MGILIGGIIPALLFGITGMLQKASARTGIATSLYLFFIGAGVIGSSAMIFLLTPDRTISSRSALYSVLMGAVWAIGTGLVAIGIFRYGVPVSKLIPLYNMNTLVAVVLSLIVFSEWQSINLIRLLGGAALIIAGGILVSKA